MLNVSQINENFPSINWTYYLDQIFNDVQDSSCCLMVKNVDHLMSISELIMNTDTRILANFLGWKIVLESYYYAGHAEWNRMGRQLWKHLDGRPAMKEKLPICVSMVRDDMAIGMSALYVQNSDQAENGKKFKLVRQMVANIKADFLNNLKEVTWMDQDSKNQAIRKTEKMELFVGYPSQLLNDTAVEEVYKDLAINRSSSYLENMYSVLRWKTFENVLTIQKPNEKKQ